MNTEEDWKREREFERTCSNCHGRGWTHEGGPCGCDEPTEDEETLTPRHEAPSEETAEQEIALALRHARNRMQSGKVVLADMDAIVDATNFLEDQARARQMAPAEGAGEGWNTWSGGENPLPDDYAEVRRRDGQEVVSATNRLDWLHSPRRSDSVDIVGYRPLRARSSAPEAREVRTHPTGEAIQDALIAGFLHGVGMGPWDDMHDYIAVCARDYAMGEPLPARTAAPSADKLRIAVEALDGLRDDIVSQRDAITHPGGRRAHFLDGTDEIRVEVLSGLIDTADQALAALKAERA